jgi:hypothetical protein
MLETYLAVLELAYFEVGEAFGGLVDENVWKRPAAGLLSVGELAGHIAYWDALRLSSDGSEWHPNPANCPLESPFLDPRFTYYPMTLASEPSEAHRAMTAADVLEELQSLHASAVAILRARNPDLGATDPPNHFAEHLKYGVFHVSYHTGQIYTVRHLLGEETPDN